MFQKFLSAFQKNAVGVSTPAALPLFGLAPTLTGKTVTTESALRVPAVACAVALIAETVGSLNVDFHPELSRVFRREVSHL